MTEPAGPATHESLLHIAAQLDVTLDAAQADKLLRYLDLIGKWNKVYNLTALRDPSQMWTHHLLDSLAVMAPLRRQLARMGDPAGNRPIRLLDVGSGAGLPGVVIAVCCPDIEVSCVDAVAKKAAFVRQVAGELGLSNLHGLHGRVESLRGTWDVVCSRAFASLADFTRWSVSTLTPTGTWLAMKGADPEAEVAELPASVDVFHVEQLHVPGLDAARCIVWMRKNPC